MFKKLINKIAQALVNATKSVPTQVANLSEMKASSKEYVKVNSTFTKQKPDYDNMTWREVPREITSEWLADIQGEIIAKGYASIPEILEQYRSEMVQQFVMFQKISLGEYSPEEDNLDALTKAQLVTMASALNQLQFEKRMKESGKSNSSKAQLDVLRKNGVAEKDLPLDDRFEASRMIEKIFASKGIKTGATTQLKYSIPSEAQISLVKKLCTQANVDVLTVDISTRTGASASIKTLQETMAKNGIVAEVRMCSDAQIEYAKRLLTQMNKRMTAKKLDAYKAMTSQDMSTALNTLRDESNLAHPNCSEGQVSYIASLCSSLTLPCNLVSTRLLTKQEAGATIDKLSKQYLYVLSRITSPSMTLESINAMSKEAVTTLISQIKIERKTRNYTKDAETGDDVAI